MIAYTTMRTNIQTILADTAAATWTAGEIDLLIADCCREVAQYYPHIGMIPYTIEGRYGTAQAAGTTAHLADSTKAQFVAGDVGKAVYNSTDKTWAVITVAGSASDVTLNANIMAANEAYRILNPNCTQPNQINIANAFDYMGIKYLEYPVGEKRSPDRIDGDILTIAYDNAVNDTRTAQSSAYKDVYVYFKWRHLISQLTDFAGAISASAAVGATTLACSALQSAGTIEKDQEFTLATSRYTYRVAVSATIASNTVSITFFPALEAAIATTGGVVTFVQSTLPTALEPIFANYVAGRAAIQRCSYLAVNQLVAGAGPYTALKAWGEEKVEHARRELTRYVGVRTTELYPRT